MFATAGKPRSTMSELFSTLSALSPEEFEERCSERDRTLQDRGVTFAHSGEELPFPLDPIPRLIDLQGVVAARSWPHPARAHP